MVGRKESVIRGGLVMPAGSKNKEKSQDTLIRIRGKPRKTVGSRNPYALAEHILGVKIDWKQSSPTAVQSLLEKVNDERFYKMFDDHDNPLPDTKTLKKSGKGATTKKNAPRRKK
jgi:hypothetical protein